MAKRNRAKSKVIILTQFPFNNPPPRSIEMIADLRSYQKLIFDIYAAKHASFFDGIDLGDIDEE